MIKVLKSEEENGISLESIKFHKTDNKFSANILCRKLIAFSEMRRIESALRESVDGCGIDVSFSFPDAADILNIDFDSAASVLNGSICESIPVLKPVLELSSWSYRQNRIILTAPASGFFLFSEPMLKKMQKIIEALYGLHLHFEVTFTDDIPIPDSPEKSNKFNEQSQPGKKTAESGTKEKVPADNEIIYGKIIKKSVVASMDSVKEDSGRVTVQGKVFGTEIKTLQNDASKNILLFNVTDFTNTLPVKMFLNKADSKRVMEKLEDVCKSDGFIRVRGDCYPDKYTHELCVNPFDINLIQMEQRMDRSSAKRVELHLHTQLSSMDALTRVKDVFDTAAKWGHRAVAVTDHGVVQAFPDAWKNSLSSGVKLIFGMEGYLLPDSDPIDIPEEFVSFFALTDKNGSKTERLVEIAAVKYQGGLPIDRFHSFINSGIDLSADFTMETGIKNEDLRKAPSANQAIPMLLEFIGSCILVTHDPEKLSILRRYSKLFNKEAAERYLDTSLLAHYLFRDKKDLSLAALAEDLLIPVNGTGACALSEVCAELLLKMIPVIKNSGSSKLPLMAGLPSSKEKGHGHHSYHIIMLAKDQAGLKNLYRLVSYSHLYHFHSVPRIPRSLLMLHREGLILGSACESGELFQAVLQKKGREQIEGIARQYDYLEIQPIENNFFMLRNNTAKDKEELRDLNRRIVCLGDELGIPVVATCDVHFLDPADNIFRKILLHSKGYEDVEFQPPLYFRTTDEMLEEFAYLGSEKAYEVVVTNSNAIADRCEELKPYPDGTHAPKIEGAEEELKNRAVSMAHEIYGPVLPETVQARLTKELNSIITNGFASLYLMAERLVKKSVGDGYLVGSRGSVGSSFVATMAGITEVNPLPPHYVCPKCKNSEFDVGKPISSCGVDLPDKLCPKCGTKYRKLGYEIPFEVFLGFHGDKTPDIDLNFSGEYQPIAHQYTETMFGEGHAFRAGTISAVQDKTVYGYVKAYCAEMNKTVSKAEIDRLVQGCSGVKRTTGQHPGGIVIVPADMDIMDFTPVQYPADQKDKGTITTHFDFHALDDRLVKLDILGHVDPTALKMLHDMTGLDPRSIPLDDEETMKLYSSSEPLKISLEELDCDVGSLGIPEVGTTFVRQMLKNTRPTTMEELVRIAGLSHGTDVWTNNAETLVLNGTATLSQVICTRDDIMNYIMAHGGEPSMAFKIMEKVRKGKGLSEEQEAYLNTINIPTWFIESCKKIKYMFPRAHAAAYVMMSFRVAFYKVHFPLQFYAVYLSVRADAFDITFASGGAERVLKSIRAIEQKGDSASENEQKMITHLEVVYEMNLRGIELLPVDLYKSDSVKFIVEGNAIRPPFSSVSGVGINAAQSIAEVCKSTVFTSIEDFETKTKANSAVVRALREIGCLGGLPESSQLCLF